MAPDKLVRHYDWAGYDVLAITDHWFRTAEPSTNGLLVIPSAELNAQAGGPQHDAHVLALGIETDPQQPEDAFASLPEVVARVRAERGGPELHELALDDGWATVRCSPAASVTILAGRRRGARANAGRLGYPHRAEILERDADGLITAVRLERPRDTPYGRLEVADTRGRRAWTNPLWI